MIQIDNCCDLLIFLLFPSLKTSERNILSIFLIAICSTYTMRHRVAAEVSPKYGLIVHRSKTLVYCNVRTERLTFLDTCLASEKRCLSVILLSYCPSALNWYGIGRFLLTSAAAKMEVLPHRDYHVVLYPIEAP